MKNPKHFDLNSHIIHCLVSHAFFSSISSFILPFSNLFTGIFAFIEAFCFLKKIAHCTKGNNFGILEHGSVYLISIQAVLSFYDKNTKGLIKHVYL